MPLPRITRNRLIKALSKLDLSESSCGCESSELRGSGARRGRDRRSWAAGTRICSLVVCTSKISMAPQALQNGWRRNMDNRLEPFVYSVYYVEKYISFATSAWSGVRWTVHIMLLSISRSLRYEEEAKRVQLPGAGTGMKVRDTWRRHESENCGNDLSVGKKKIIVHIVQESCKRRH